MAQSFKVCKGKPANQTAHYCFVADCWNVFTIKVKESQPTGHVFVIKPEKNSQVRESIRGKTTKAPKKMENVEVANH